jgi:hypothetical protein
MFLWITAKSALLLLSRADEIWSPSRSFFCFVSLSTHDVHSMQRLYLALYVFLDFFFVNYNRQQSVASVLHSFSKNGRFTPLLLFQGAPRSYPVW